MQNFFLKNLIPCLLIFTCGIGAEPVARMKLNVLQLYGMVPNAPYGVAKWLAREKSYSIRQVSETFLARCEKDICKKEFPVTVDIKNGFISINLKITGASVAGETEEAALFETTDGRQYLLVTNSLFLSVGIEHSVRAFYLDGGHLREAPELLPAIGALNFVSKDCRLSNAARIAELLEYKVQVPRYGTDLKFLISRSAIVETVSMIGTEADMADIKTFLNCVQYDSLTYSWDKDQGVFKKSDNR